MQKYPIQSKWIICLLVAVLCTSCLAPSHLQRMGDPGISAAALAAPRTLVVLRIFVKGGLSYPAGRYAATLTDDNGVYYQAPEAVLRGDLSGSYHGTTTGGFYVSFDHPPKIRHYMDYNGFPLKIVGDVPELQYRFEK